MPDEELEESLIAVIGKSGGGDLLREAAEFSLKTMLSDSTLKDLPVAGVVAKLYGTAVGVQGYVFSKKIRRFLTELQSIPTEDRERFAEKMEREPESRRRTAETLITLLDRLDDLEKCPLLARAFSGYVRGVYDFSTFRRFAAAIDRCLVSDILVLRELDSPTQLDAHIGAVLAGTGLIMERQSGGLAIPMEGTRTAYVRSELGESFFQNVLQNSHDGDQVDI